MDTAVPFDYMHIVGETWTEGPCPDGYGVTFARQFRYDAARARYLNRDLDVSVATGLMHNPPIYNPLSDTWSDHDGDQIYGDFTLSGSTATNQRSFQPGIATVDLWAGSGGTNTKYYHADLIGTTRAMTLGTTGLPDATAAAVYTAFGERLSVANPRYGYAGASGYQAHDSSIPYLHVGHRYYDPASGGFLQRDPTGTEGDLHVYRYVYAIPSILVDPPGLSGCIPSPAPPAAPPRQPQPQVEGYAEVEGGTSGIKGKVGIKVKWNSWDDFWNSARDRLVSACVRIAVGNAKVGRKIAEIAPSTFLTPWHAPGNPY